MLGLLEPALLEADLVLVLLLLDDVDDMKRRALSSDWRTRWHASNGSRR